MTNLIPDLTLSTSIDKATDVVVIGIADAAGSPALVGVTADLEKAAGKQDALLRQVTALGGKSDIETTVTLAVGPRRCVVVGLGDVDVTPDRIRRAVGAALRAVAGLPGAEGLAVAVSLELADPELIRAAGEGALLGAHGIARISRKEAAAPVARISVVTPKASASNKEALSRAAVVAAAVRRARDWVNLPGNALYPETFAEAARASLRSEKVTVEVLDDKALEKGGYGGILAVGGGSDRKPRLVRMQYAPRGAGFHLALVGKGITFDSGGLDIKPAGQMADMKSDMSGAAAVISAIGAIAALGLRIKVTAYASMAENMPSGSSYRSSDVLTMFDGQTVENVNTDAEGRLVMADAIARAGLDQPDLIVDVATLTGACIVALGTRVAGLMASDDDTADRVLDAAETAGEEFWQLPITDQIRSELKSDIADFRSGGKTRWGGALVAAAFLQKFVPQGTPWAHLDIAGPAFNGEGPFGYTPTGGTGAAVRTLVALASQLSSK